MHVAPEQAAGGVGGGAEGGIAQGKVPPGLIAYGQIPEALIQDAAACEANDALGSLRKFHLGGDALGAHAGNFQINGSAVAAGGVAKFIQGPDGDIEGLSHRDGPGDNGLDFMVAGGDNAHLQPFGHLLIPGGAAGV